MIGGIDIDQMIQDDLEGTNEDWIVALALLGVVRGDELWLRSGHADPPLPDGIRLTLDYFDSQES